MKKCVVIGSGFAGLSSAVYLSKAGFKVTLLESSPKPGGRAYSFCDNETGDIIDNGQHIMMGCYKYTLDFFKQLQAEDNLIFQNRLEINFIKENFNLIPLKAPKIFYPLNLLSALINYKALSAEEKFRFISLFTDLLFHPGKDFEDISVNDWLKNETQSENVRKSFWEVLAIGALNTNVNKASAKIFTDILKEMFFRGSRAATIIIPKFGLSETYCEKSLDFIKTNRGEIFFGESVVELKDRYNKIYKIITSKREITNFDCVISAVPYYAYKKIIKNEKLNYNFSPEYSSILSIHIWLKENFLKKKFYGLINSPLHWIFNHGKHITAVISYADYLIEKDKEEIYELVCKELKKYFLINCELISSYKIIKEKRATFVPSKEILNNRPKSETVFKNFFLAGDWTNTGLPSTIESAVKSGKIASDLIIESI